MCELYYLAGDMRGVPISYVQRSYERCKLRFVVPRGAPECTAPLRESPELFGSSKRHLDHHWTEKPHTCLMK